MKTLSTFVIALLVVGFLFLAVPEKGYSGFDPMLGGPPCCELVGDNTCIGGGEAESFCNDSQRCSNFECEFFENRICAATSVNNGECVLPTQANVPTLSEWGLIALAGTLGIIGFIMVIRRRKVTA